MTRQAKWALNFMVFGCSFLLFGAFMMFFFKTNVKVEYNYIQGEPVYTEIEEYVNVDVYEQNSPILPVKQEVGKELVLLDKSGSMEEFVTSLYENNIEFFTINDVWAFDTEVHQDVTVTEIEFGNDTNIFQALNMAAENGYDTVWLCSDLEHNTGEIHLTDQAKGLNIIVYSPKILDEEKVSATIKMLTEASSVKVVTIN